LEELNKEIVKIISDYSWLVSLISASIAVIMNIVINIKEDKRKKEYEIEIEKFRAEISNKENVLNATLASLGSNNEQYYEKCLEATETLWEVVLSISNHCSQMILAYNILLPSEYRKHINSEYFDKSIYDAHRAMNFEAEIRNTTDKIRPFVHLDLWNIFSLYSIFMMRAAYKFEEGVKRNEVPTWYDDEHLYSIFKSIKGEIRIDDYKRIGMFQFIMNIAEEKIIHEMHEMIKGHKISEDTLNRSIEIARQVSETTRMSATIG